MTGWGSCLSLFESPCYNEVSNSTFAAAGQRMGTSMSLQDFFWRLFELTGSIRAYLLYRSTSQSIM